MFVGDRTTASTSLAGAAAVTTTLLRLRACMRTYAAVERARFRLAVVDHRRRQVLAAAVRHGERHEVLFDAGARYEITRMRAVHVAAQTANLK